HVRIRQVRTYGLPALWMTLFAAAPFQISAVDLSHATVVTPPNLSGPEQKAVTMLVEEVEKRSQIRWHVSQTWPQERSPVIVVSSRTELKFFGKNAPTLAPSAPAEGYQVEAGRDSVFVIGNDARGVLFGIGRLLRALHM